MYSQLEISRKFSLKILSVITLICFTLSSIGPVAPALAQSLPTSASLTASSGLFQPMVLNGLRIDRAKPFQFDFIVSSVDETSERQDVEKQSTELIKYFLASLTTPDEDFWVNLSPTEPDRIIPSVFGKTEMGQTLLAEDYLLKQLAASLMGSLLEEKAGSGKLGEGSKREENKLLNKNVLENISPSSPSSSNSSLFPLLSSDFLSRIWIVPDKAEIVDTGDAVYIANARLKVMMEEDLKAEERMKRGDGSKKEDPSSFLLQASYFKTKILPAIEREVNTSPKFTKLRQIYHSLILATWYKENLKESLLAQVYAGKNKISGVEGADQKAKEKIYQEYLKAFQEGIQNFIKEEYDPQTQEVVQIKYFTGGLNILPSLTRVDQAQLAKRPEDNQALVVTAKIEPSNPGVKQSSVVIESTLTKKSNLNLIVNAFNRFISESPRSIETEEDIDEELLRNSLSLYQFRLDLAHFEPGDLNKTETLDGQLLRKKANKMRDPFLRRIVTLLADHIDDMALTEYYLDHPEKLEKQSDNKRSIKVKKRQEGIEQELAVLPKVLSQEEVIKLGRRIRAIRREERRIDEVSVAMGLGKITLGKIELGRSQLIQLKTILRIANYYNLPLGQFFTDEAPFEGQFYAYDWENVGKIIAKNLIYWRNKRGMTIDDFANILGIDDRTYEHFEKGKSPSCNTLISMVHALKISLDDLLRERIDLDFAPIILKGDDLWMSLPDTLDTVSIGERIKQLRLKIGETQEEFAKSIGMRKDNYGHVERGTYKSYEATTIINIARQHSVSILYLLTGQDSDSPSVIAVPEQVRLNLRSNIRTLLKFRRLTHAKLAAMVGYTDDRISRILMSEQLPDIDRLIRFAKAFQLPIDVLLGSPEKLETYLSQQFRLKTTGLPNEVLLDDPVMIGKQFKEIYEKKGKSRKEIARTLERNEDVIQKIENGYEPYRSFKFFIDAANYLQEPVTRFLAVEPSKVYASWKFKPYDFEVIKLFFGQNMAKIMREKGISSTQMAELMNVSNQMINNYINNKELPTIKALLQIKKVLNVPLEQLLRVEKSEVFHFDVYEAITLLNQKGLITKDELHFAELYYLEDMPWSECYLYAIRTDNPKLKFDEFRKFRRALVQKLKENQFIDESGRLTPWKLIDPARVIIIPENEEDEFNVVKDAKSSGKSDVAMLGSKTIEHFDLNEEKDRAILAGDLLDKIVARVIEELGDMKRDVALSEGYEEDEIERQGYVLAERVFAGIPIILSKFSDPPRDFRTVETNFGSKLRKVSGRIKDPGFDPILRLLADYVDEVALRDYLIDHPESKEEIVASGRIKDFDSLESQLWNSLPTSFDPTTKVKLGKFLKELRGEESVVQRAKEIGIGKNTLFALENGQSDNVMLETILKICNFYSLSIEALLLGERNDRTFEAYDLNEIKDIIKVNFKRMRIKRGFTRRYMGLALGKEDSNYDVLEDGKHVPMLDNLLLVARTFKSGISELLHRPLEIEFISPVVFGKKSWKNLPDNVDSNAVGARLKNLRFKQGFTQKEMEKASGINHRMTRLIEAGKIKSLTWASLSLFVNYFKVSLHYILTGEEDGRPWKAINVASAQSNLAKNLKFFRDRRGFSHAELQEKSLVNKSTIQRIELNESIVSIETYVRLAKALAVPVDVLFGDPADVETYLKTQGIINHFDFPGDRVLTDPKLIGDRLIEIFKDKGLTLEGVARDLKIKLIDLKKFVRGEKSDNSFIMLLFIADNLNITLGELLVKEPKFIFKRKNSSKYYPEIQKEYFGSNLSFLMQQRGMDSKTLSQATGIGLRSINYYISGEELPSILNLVKIVMALDVSVEQLVRIENSPAFKEEVLNVLTWLKNNGTISEIDLRVSRFRFLSVPSWTLAGEEFAKESQRDFTPGKIKKITDDLTNRLKSVGFIDEDTFPFPWKFPKEARFPSGRVNLLDQPNDEDAAMLAKADETLDRILGSVWNGEEEGNLTEYIHLLNGLIDDPSLHITQDSREAKLIKIMMSLLNPDQFDLEKTRGIFHEINQNVLSQMKNQRNHWALTMPKAEHWLVVPLLFYMPEDLYEQRVKYLGEISPEVSAIFLGMLGFHLRTSIDMSDADKGDEKAIKVLAPIVVRYLGELLENSDPKAFSVFLMVLNGFLFVPQFDFRNDTTTPEDAHQDIDDSEIIELYEGFFRNTFDSSENDILKRAFQEFQLLIPARNGEILGSLSFWNSPAGFVDLVNLVLYNQKNPRLRTMLADLVSNSPRAKSFVEEKRRENYRLATDNVKGNRLLYKVYQFIRQNVGLETADQALLVNSIADQLISKLRYESSISSDLDDRSISLEVTSILDDYYFTLNYLSEPPRALGKNQSKLSLDLRRKADKMSDRRFAGFVNEAADQIDQLLDALYKKSHSKKVNLPVKIDSKFMKMIGKKIEILLSGETMAYVSRATGIHVNTLNRIIKGNAESINIETLITLANYFNISLDVIFFNKEKKRSFRLYDKDHIREIIAKNVARIRILKGISVGELSEQIGIDSKNYSNIENGRGLSWQVIFNLASSLNVDLEDLLRESVELEYAVEIVEEKPWEVLPVSLDGKAIGARIKSERIKMGLTRKEVEGFLGVGNNNVAYVESGNWKDCRLDQIIKYSKILNVSPYYLITGKENKYSLKPHDEIDLERMRVQVRKNILVLRKMRGISREEFSSLTGMAITNVAAIELKNTNPELGTICRMARALQVPIEVILGLEGSVVRYLQEERLSTGTKLTSAKLLSDTREVGSRIKSVRESAGESLDVLAQAIGVDQKLLVRLEAGELKTDSLMILVLIANHYKKPLDIFLLVNPLRVYNLKKFVPYDWELIKRYFGSRLQSLVVDKAGWTGEELANKIGVSKQTVSNVFNNKNLPNLGIFLEISRVLSIANETYFRLENSSQHEQDVSTVLNEFLEQGKLTNSEVDAVTLYWLEGYSWEEVKGFWKKRWNPGISPDAFRYYRKKLIKKLISLNFIDQDQHLTIYKLLVPTQEAQSNTRVEVGSQKVDSALMGNSNQINNLEEYGGIDLNPKYFKNEDRLKMINKDAKPRFDIPIEDLQKAPGFVPRIINIAPMPSLPVFLGLQKEELIQIGSAN